MCEHTCVGVNLSMHACIYQLQVPLRDFRVATTEVTMQSDLQRCRDIRDITALISIDFRKNNKLVFNFCFF